MRGIVKRTALLLLMAIFGSCHAAFADCVVTSVGTADAPVTRVTNTSLPAGMQITNVDLKGDGTEAHPFEIGSVEQWTAFATIANNADWEHACAILTADITFTGNHLQPGENQNWSYTHNFRLYKDIFDGRGHTITLNQQRKGGSNSTTDTYGGLFWHVARATIKNLRVAGRVHAGSTMSAAFIQNVNSTIKEPVYIDNCVSSVDNYTSGDKYQAGGFVSDIHKEMTLNMNNCLMDGKFSLSSTNYKVTYSGGFVGYAQNASNDYSTSIVNIHNSYFQPQSTDASYNNFSTFSSGGELHYDHSYYLFTYSGGGPITYQGSDASGMSKTDIVDDLNTDATKVTINNQQVDPWVVHNDTIYLKTFAKYVDITGWVAGGSPNDPQLIGNRSSGDVTYQYQPYGGSYSSTVPTTAGRYTVKVTVPAGADANEHTWNAWESTMEFCIVSAPTATSYTYNGTAQNLVTAGTAAVGTFYYRLGETGSWSTTIPTQTTPGDYTVYYYVKGDESHNDIGSEEAPAGSVACSISKIEVGLSWNIPATNPVYDGQTHCITANATGMINDDVIGVTVTGEQTNAGEHTATASELTGTNNGYYKLPAANTQTFIISTRPITVTPNEGQCKTYGEDDPTLTYSVDNIVSGESLSGSLSRADGSDVGNYAITQGGVTDANNSNYTITFTSGKTFAITQKTVGITWGPTILTYNNTAQAPTAAATGLVGGDVCNVTVTGQQTAVGVYSGDNVAIANALDNNNYQLPDPKPTTAFEIANPLSMSFAAGQLWGTWYGAYNYQVPTGMIAYKVSSVSGSTVTVDAIDYVPANTGVLINRTATEAANVSSNIYNGVTAGNTSLLVSGNPTPYTDYILFNDQFVLSSVSTIGDHRCYLPGSGVVAGTRGLNIVVGGDDTTDIEQKVIDIIETGEWYDMQGRRIVRPHKKGIYIRDGKKVVIK